MPNRDIVMSPEQALNILTQVSAAALINRQDQFQTLKALEVIKKLIEDQTNGSNKKS